MADHMSKESWHIHNICQRHVFITHVRESWHIHNIWQNTCRVHIFICVTLQHSYIWICELSFETCHTYEYVNSLLTHNIWQNIHNTWQNTCQKRVHESSHIHMCHTATFITYGRTHVKRELTYSYVWHVSFICVTCLVHMCDMSHSWEAS